MNDDVFVNNGNLLYLFLQFIYLKLLQQCGIVFILVTYFTSNNKLTISMST